MISKNTIKLIRSLEQRKFRKAEGLFVAEGNKLVEDNMSSMKCQKLIATSEWFAAHPEAKRLSEECLEVSKEEMSKVSLMQTPQEVLGVFYIPFHKADVNLSILGKDSLLVALDCVQDPGNLGTIIRLCDWFGIRDIICSTGTADCYSPKVVQATMGAIARVRVHYVDLPSYLSEAREAGAAIYGTFLEGTNIYQTDLTPNGIIVMGNEGQGICEAVGKQVTKKLNIPSYPVDSLTSESLNVGIATAITVAEFRRRG